MTTTPRTASTLDARKRQAERDLLHGTIGNQPVEFSMPSAASASSLPPTTDLPPVPDSRRAAELIWFHLAHAPMVSDEDRAALNAYARDIYDRAVSKPTPPHAPRESWRVISTDRDKPTLAKVTFGSDYATTAEVFVEGGYVWRVMDATAPQGVGSSKIGTIAMLTDVELLHTHDPETHVPVERALIDEAARAKHVAEPWGPLYDVVNALAALAAGAES